MSSEKSRRMKRLFTSWILPYIAMLVVVVFGPFALSSAGLFLVEQILIQVLFATSTNFLFGKADMPSFGQAAFLGVGAYVVALTFSNIWFGFALVLAALVGGLIAAVLAAVSIKTEGIVFANVTLALGQGLYLIAMKSPWLGGENGIPGVEAAGLTGSGLWYVVGLVVMLSMFVLQVIYYSPYGRMLDALRQEPIRLKFLGVPVDLYKISAFVLAGAGTGIAGGLLAYSSAIVTPGTMYWINSGYPILMILVGGIGFFWGPAVGAIIITLILNWISGMLGWNLIILGSILIFVLLWRSDGVLGGFSSLVARYSTNRR